MHHIFAMERISKFTGVNEGQTPSQFGADCGFA
jgi:hypothetical protein